MTLRTRLMLLFLALTLGVTALVGTLAYEAAVNSVNAVARRTVGILAQDRRASLVQRLVRQHRRGKRFLKQTPACTRLPIDAAACERAVRAFAVEEELLAAQIVDNRHPLTAVHTASGPDTTAHPALLSDIPLLRPGQLARFSLDSSGYVFYDVAIPGDTGATGAAGASSADWLLLRYALRPSDPIFTTGSALGSVGESFLADASGRPLTPLRFTMSADEHGVINSPAMLDCLAGHDGEVVGSDYRGVAIVHGYRYVAEIGGGCIMAHVSQQEIEAPVRAIRNRLLLVGAVLALLACLVSILLARAITAPLMTLVRHAEAVARNEPFGPVVEDGVPEVRTLARAFTSMTTAIQRRTEEREFALAARARFYHAMSHELRTPLNAVVGYLDLLGSDLYGALPAPAHEAIERSQRAAFLLRDLIDDVLDLAKIEAGRIEVNRARVNLPALLDDLLATLEPVAAAGGVELRLECDDAIVIETDARRVGQILLNLVSNAIKFGQRAPVVIRCRHGTESAVVIEVVDHGPGIPAEDLERVFEEYVQLQEGQHVGTGLGLAISRRLAELLGGSLVAESTVGEGATFRLMLP